MTCQTCSKQKWSGPARGFNFLLVEHREREKESEADEWLLCLLKVWEVILVSSYQEVLQGTTGYCFLPTFHWLMWPATAVGTVPVDIPDCLLRPCRQCWVQGMSLLWNVARPKPTSLTTCYRPACTHTHSCTLTACSAHIQTRTRTHWHMNSTRAGWELNLTLEPSL